MRLSFPSTQAMALAAVLVAANALQAGVAQAQATSAPSSAARALGTVRSLGNGTLTLSTDKGESLTVTLPDTLRVVQLAPGSTDLKTAQPATGSDIAEGDRVLVTGKPGDNGAITALRVVLMKSSAIAASNATRQQDWQRRGSGGTVTAVDTAAQTLSLTAGARKETVHSTAATTFRRYAPGSVKFEDARSSKLNDIHPGDQVRVRGDKSTDGMSIAAEEVVSGAFRNLAGVVTKVDAGSDSLTLNDLSTKKPVTVSFAGDSDLRSLPPEMAARFAARARGAAAGAAGSTPPGARPGYAAGARSSGDSPATAGNTTARSSAPGSGAFNPSAGRPAGAGGGDLSQVIARLPKTTLAELKPGEAVMIVASGESASGSALTAITLLSGVEPLLAASPGSAGSFSISPWSLGGGGEGGEGAGPQ